MIAYLLDSLLFLPVVIARNFWIVAASWSASNAMANFEVAQIIGFRLRVAPEAIVGRVMGAVRLIVMGGLVPGVLVFG